MITDINVDMGFHPIPLFPCYAGYANGFLIQMGVSVPAEFVLIYFRQIVIFLVLRRSPYYCISTLDSPLYSLLRFDIRELYRMKAG